MTPNTPQPQSGERWRCVFDPAKPKRKYLDQRGPTCQVVKVEGGRVTFQWLGHYLYVSQQTVTLEKFLSDFTRVEARP